MCGFVGVVRGGGRAVRREELLALAPVVARRGPDGTGVAVAGGLGLVASRLAIQGGSEGDQPLASADGRFLLAYNGELFGSHRRRLRGLLRTEGAGEVRAASDTALLLAFLAHRLAGRRAGDPLPDEATLPLRGGMYAFALVDLVHREVLLHTDPDGIKPLYVLPRPAAGETWFGSVRAPLWAVGGRPTGLRPEGLAARLVLPWGPDVPAAGTAVEDVAGRVGLVAEATAGRVAWRPVPAAPRAAADAAPGLDLDDLRVTLEDAAAEAAETAGPVTLFLSGGLDSAAVAAWCGRPDALAVTGRFAPVGGPLDESDLAAEVAGALGLRHEVLTLDDRDLVLDLPAVIDALEEPLGGPGSLALHRVAARAQRHGRVALSGTGGDERFGGYTRVALALGRAGAWTEGYDALRTLTEAAGPDPRRRWLRAVDRAGDLVPYLHPDVAARLPLADAREAAFAALFGPGGLAAGLPPARALAAAEVATSLRMLLAVEDRVTMSLGLESRPVLSLGRVADAAASLPEGWLVGADGEGKRALRAALEGRIPDAVRTSRRKRGFPTPFHRAATGAGRDVAAAVLADRRFAERGWWDVPRCRALLAEARPDHDRALFSVLSFETWARRFVDGDAGVAPGRPAS